MAQFVSKSLKKYTINFKHSSVAISALECGLGKLPWGSVKQLSKTTLNDMDSCIIYVIEPKV